MCQSEARLAAEVAEMMRQAERVDAEEDAVHGADNRGGDLQGEMARRESRLAKIRKAKADLEQHAKDQAAQKARAKASKNGQGDEVAEESAGRAAEAATPAAKAQRNFTDPDSRIMKTADGSFHYCYNAQAVVDEANQVIVATDFADSGADNPAFGDMLDQTMTNTGVTPGQTLADAGYFSEANIEAAREAGTDPLIARAASHTEKPCPTRRGAGSQGCDTQSPDGPQTSNEEGQGAYSRRKVSSNRSSDR